MLWNFTSASKRSKLYLPLLQNFHFVKSYFCSENMNGSKFAWFPEGLKPFRGFTNGCKMKKMFSWRAVSSNSHSYSSFVYFTVETDISLFLWFGIWNEIGLSCEQTQAVMVFFFIFYFLLCVCNLFCLPILIFLSSHFFFFPSFHVFP